MEPQEIQPITNQPISYKLLFSQKEHIAHILEMIGRAEKSIDIEAFYFLPDLIGRPILDALIEKAKSGVTVRVLVDAMGSFSLRQSLYPEAFRKVGAHIRFFNSFMPFSKAKKTLWFLRNHRRTIIIDENELLVGSLCIGEATQHWIETSISIRGSESAHQAKKVFNKTWHKSLHKTFRIGSSKKTSTDSFSYLTQSPLQGERTVYKLLNAQIKSAKREVFLIAPYIILDRRLMRRIKQARRKGVAVHIITSERTDSTLADLARNTHISRLLELGVIIHLSKTMIHSKVHIFDDESAMIGTFNLDNISMRYNYECILFINDSVCVQELLHAIQTQMLLTTKTLTIEEWRKRSVFTKIFEKIVWPIRKFL